MYKKKFLLTGVSLLASFTIVGAGFAAWSFEDTDNVYGSATNVPGSFTEAVNGLGYVYADSAYRIIFDQAGISVVKNNTYFYTDITTGKYVLDYDSTSGQPVPVVLYADKDSDGNAEYTDPKDEDGNTTHTLATSNSNVEWSNEYNGYRITVDAMVSGEYDSVAWAQWHTVGTTKATDSNGEEEVYKFKSLWVIEKAIYTNLVANNEKLNPYFSWDVSKTMGDYITFKNQYPTGSTETNATPYGDNYLGYVTYDGSTESNVTDGYSNDKADDATGLKYDSNGSENNNYSGVFHTYWNQTGGTLYGFKAELSTDYVEVQCSGNGLLYYVFELTFSAGAYQLGRSFTWSPDANDASTMNIYSYGTHGLYYRDYSSENGATDNTPQWLDTYGASGWSFDNYKSMIAALTTKTEGDVGFNEVFNGNGSKSIRFSFSLKREENTDNSDSGK